MKKIRLGAFVLFLSVLCLTSAFRCAHTSGCVGQIPVDMVCCSDQIVPSYLCCDTKIMKPDQICCAGQYVVDLKTEICCGGSRFPKATYDCCDNTPRTAGTCSDKPPVGFGGTK